jgi:hypothetical protein
MAYVSYSFPFSYQRSGVQSCSDFERAELTLFQISLAVLMGAPKYPHNQPRLFILENAVQLSLEAKDVNSGFFVYNQEYDVLDDLCELNSLPFSSQMQKPGLFLTQHTLICLGISLASESRSEVHT